MKTNHRIDKNLKFISTTFIKNILPSNSRKRIYRMPLKMNLKSNNKMVKRIMTLRKTMRRV